MIWSSRGKKKLKITKKQPDVSTVSSTLVHTYQLSQLSLSISTSSTKEKEARSCYYNMDPILKSSGGIATEHEDKTAA